MIKYGADFGKYKEIKLGIANKNKIGSVISNKMSDNEAKDVNQLVEKLESTYGKVMKNDK